MNFFESQLRRLFGDTEDARFIGRCCFIPADDGNLVKAEFVTQGVHEEYVALQMSVINRADGVIDKTLLRFGDYFSRNSRGQTPHIWCDSGKHEWYDQIVRRVAKKLGYRVDKIINLISEQSPEINRAVLSDEDIGAGDQGIMFGYATRETASRLPYAFDVANRIIAALEDDADNNPDTILKGDAKTQVTVDLDTGEIVTVVVSVCHKEGCDLDEIQHYVLSLVGDECICDDWIINPAGTWTVGGAEADCGLTGRKIVCDQYGGFCRVGGGAFSGKDPSKVDRSASYMAHKIACDLLEKFDLEWCEIQIGYAIGMSQPVSLSIRNDVDMELFDYVANTYNLTPAGIIRELDLLHADYETIAEGCHFYNKYNRTGRWK